MLLIENILLALAGIGANKMRSILTMLGIVIGISSVIAIMTVGDSINNSVMSSMDNMGMNNITAGVQTKSATQGDYFYLDSTSIKEKDMITEEMLADFELAFKNRIEGISLSKSIGEGKADNNKLYANVNIVGGNSIYLKGKKLELLAGRNLNEAEQEAARKVVIVSDKLVSNMFNGDSQKALGKSLAVTKDGKFYEYTIVGVYKYTESSYSYVTGSEKDMATDCYIPLKLAQQQSRSAMAYDSFEVIGKKGEDIDILTSDIANHFNNKYYVNNEKFQINTYNMKSMVAETQGMLTKIKLAISAIAGISLLVGGIGVMNIMIVSVTERTREIGTRKALGATNGSVRLQFLIEAVVICIIGGAIGIILGLAAGFGLVSLMGYAGHASMSGIIFCVLFSAAFGIFFGYYPANRAAKLNPIEALRYE